MIRPQCVVIAGPNGAGKTSAAPELLKDTIGVAAFVNADVIAEGLAGFGPDAVSVDAGRIMLKRLAALMAAKENFAFESTFAGRSVQRVMDRAAALGYDVHVYYLWLPSPDLAVARVKRRVGLGGHNVPEDVVRRRFQRSLRNLPHAWTRGVTTWRLYDASAFGPPRVIASGVAGEPPEVIDERMWPEVLRQTAGSE